MDTNSGNLAPRQLTRRQAECVELVSKGLSSKEVARELGISPSTVDNHIAAVMHQFNLPNRTAMTRFFGHERSVDPSSSIVGQRWANDPEGDGLVELNRAVSNSDTVSDECIFCKINSYIKTSLLPSFIFAAQTAVFVVILLFILKVAFDLAY